MILRWLAILALAAFCAPLSARAQQQTPRAYFGADVADLAAADVDALGWAEARGVKLLAVAEGGPAFQAGMTPGDVIEAVDGAQLAGNAAFETMLAGKAPGAALALQAWRPREGKAPQELRLKVTLSAPPQPPVARREPSGEPILMLDTGGHMANINAIAFTPDGKQLVSASDDKTIRVWDLATGKTVRTIRGESAPGDPGKIYSMALSPDGKWLAAGGWFCPPRTSPRADAKRTSASMISPAATLWRC